MRSKSLNARWIKQWQWQLYNTTLIHHFLAIIFNFMDTFIDLKLMMTAIE